MSGEAGTGSAHVEYLNSAAFQEAINAFKNACSQYTDIKSKVASGTNKLLGDWEGEGAVQFEKDYKLIYQQLDDILDLMYELYNGLIDAQAEYLKTDQELSKQFTL